MHYDPCSLNFGVVGQLTADELLMGVGHVSPHYFEHGRLSNQDFLCEFWGGTMREFSTNNNCVHPPIQGFK